MDNALMDEDQDSLFTIDEDEEGEGVRMGEGSRTSFYIVGSHKLQFLPSVNFIYQKLGFRERCGVVPPFVTSNVQRNSRLTSESFILRVNYLRRRREASTDPNKTRQQQEEEHKRVTFMDASSPRRSAGPAPS